jgi:hypothetical protein
MKGVELPINVIVIVVLCLVVLLAILALFWGVWTPGVAGISLEAAKNNACQMLLSTGGCGLDDSTKTINVNNFDANKDGKFEAGNGFDDTANACKANGGGQDNLYMLCKCWYLVDETSCKTRICSCP